jgi:hypothetical protein
MSMARCGARHGNCPSLNLPHSDWDQCLSSTSSDLESNCWFVFPLRRKRNQSGEPCSHATISKMTPPQPTVARKNCRAEALNRGGTTARGLGGSDHSQGQRAWKLARAFPDPGLLGCASRPGPTKPRLAGGLPSPLLHALDSVLGGGPDAGSLSSWRIVVT